MKLRGLDLGLATAAFGLLAVAIHACSSPPDNGRSVQSPNTSSVGVTSSASKASSASTGTGAAGGAGGTLNCGGSGGSGGAVVAPSDVIRPLWADYSHDYTDHDVTTALAVDSKGNVILAATFNGNIAFGGKDHAKGPAQGKADAYLYKADPNGNFVWGEQFPSPLGNGAITAMTVDPKTDNIIITGTFDSNGLYIGSAPLTPKPAFYSATGQSDIGMFIAEVDPTGKVLWSKSRYAPAPMGSGNSVEVPTSIALDPFGNIVVVGNFRGAIDFRNGADMGDPNLMLQQPQMGTPGTNVFVAKLNGLGITQFSEQFYATGQGAQVNAWGVAVDGMANIAMAGSFLGHIQFGSNASSVYDTASGNAYAIKLDPKGALTWSKNMGGAQFCEARGVVFDGNGDVAVTGYYGGSMLLDKVLSSAGDDDLFLIKMAAGDGTFLWSRTFGDDKKQRGLGLMVTSKNELVAVGFGTGSWKVGDFKLDAGMGTGAVVVKVDPSGKDMWGGVWSGTTGDDQGTVIASQLGDQPVIGGYFSKEIQFGLCQPFTSGDSNAFVAELPANPPAPAK